MRPNSYLDVLNSLSVPYKMSIIDFTYNTLFIYNTLYKYTRCVVGDDSIVFWYWDEIVLEIKYKMEEIK